MDSFEWRSNGAPVIGRRKDSHRVERGQVGCGKGIAIKAVIILVEHVEGFLSSPIPVFGPPQRPPRGPRSCGLHLDPQCGACLTVQFLTDRSGWHCG